MTATYILVKLCSVIAACRETETTYAISVRPWNMNPSLIYGNRACKGCTLFVDFERKLVYTGVAIISNHCQDE